MADKKINDLALAGTLSDPMQFETDISGTTANKVTFAQLKEGNLKYFGEVTNNPTGFRADDVSKVAVSIVEGTRTITLTPTGASFNFFVEGVEFIKTVPEAIVFDDIEGLQYIYYDETGTLQKNVGYFEGLIQKYAIVAILYWDATNKNAAVYFTENNELHGVQMSGETHDYLHETFGTRYVSGLALSNFSVDGSGGNATDAQFSFGSGEIRDEDLLITIDAISVGLGTHVLYRTGSGGDWRDVVNTGFSMITTGTGRLAWNEFTGGAWQLSEVGNNNYALIHLIATNGFLQYKSIVGQATYGTIISARNGAETEVESLILEGLPFAEWKIVGTVIVQTSNTYGNAVQSRIRSTGDPAPNDNYIDWTKEDIGPGSSSPSSHLNLAALWSGNPAIPGNAGHPQFAYRASKVFHISAEYGDYTTIQDALDANTLGNELFIVGPGTYTDDTIYFTANNQAVMGESERPANCEVTTASGKLVDPSTFTGCSISRLKISNSATNSLLSMVVNESGDSLNIYRCHLSMITSYSTTGFQPSIFAGDSLTNITQGTVYYEHNGTLNTFSDIKYAFDLNGGGIYKINNTKVTVLGTNLSYGITPGYGGDGQIHADRCLIRVNDLVSENVAGLFLTGIANYELHFNDIKVTSGGTNTAVGLWITGGPTVNVKNNVFVAENVGGAGLEYGTVMVGGTVNAALNSTTAKDGNLITGGTLNTTSLTNNFMLTSETVFTEDQAFITKKHVHDSFALLAGVSGGQILNGDTDADGFLDLSSTSNATKGGAVRLANDEIWIFKNGQNPRVLLGDSDVSGQYGYFQWDSTNDYFRVETDGTNGLKIKGNNFSVGNIFPSYPVSIALGTTELFRIENSGLTRSLISNYDTLVTNDQDFVTKKWVVDHVIGSAYWVRTGTIISPKTSGDSVQVDSFFMVERSGAADDCYYFSKNTNVGSAQEWAFGLQGTNGQFSIRDITASNNLVFGIEKGAPISSLFITDDGAIGMGALSFSVDDKLHIQDGATSLFKMKTSGLMTSQIANYDTLLSTGSQDIPSVKWTEDLVDTEITAVEDQILWERSAGVVTPKTTTDNISANRINVAYDSSWYLGKFGVPQDPVIAYDSNDYFIFDRSENSYNHYVAGSRISRLYTDTNFTRFNIEKSTGTSSEAILGLFAPTGGGAKVEFDINSGSTSSGEINVSGGWMSFCQKGDAFTADDILRLDVINKGVVKYMPRTQTIVVPGSGTTNYGILDASLYNTFVFDTTSGGTANVQGFINAVSGQANIRIAKIETAGSGVVILDHNSGVNQEILCRGGSDVTLGASNFGVVDLLPYDIGSGVNMYTSY